MDRHEFEKKTVKELREMAEAYEDITGASGKPKGELQALLAEKLGIDLHEHAAAGIGRHNLKERIRELKTLRDGALASGDKAAYVKLRSRLKHNRRQLRKVIGKSLVEQHKQEASS